MSEGPPIVRRCIGCPSLNRDNHELDYPPPLEDCDGPVELVKGLVEVTDFRTGDSTLRVGDASFDSISRGCGRELDLSRTDKLSLTINGMRTIFLLSKKTAAVTNGKDQAMLQKLGEDILEDFNSRIANTLIPDGVEDGPRRLTVAGKSKSKGEVLSGEFSPQQVWAELNMLREGSLVTVRAKQCGEVIDMVERALEEVLRDTRHMSGFRDILGSARDSNQLVIKLEVAYHKYIEDYLASHMDDNIGVTPKGYQELQEQINEVKLKKPLRAASISGVKGYLNDIAKAIENAPFFNLSRISHMRNRFIHLLLEDIEDDNASKIAEASAETMKAAAASSNSMTRLSGGVSGIANHL